MLLNEQLLPLEDLAGIDKSYHVKYHATFQLHGILFHKEASWITLTILKTNIKH